MRSPNMNFISYRGKNRENCEEAILKEIEADNAPNFTIDPQM